MNERVEMFWNRAVQALQVAEHDFSLDPNAAASRAYYAAFYAASAWFARDGRDFRRHSVLESAVHRELVKPGIWSTELGQGYSRLMELRAIGDYGQVEIVTKDEAAEAIQIARQVLTAVSQADPASFPLPA
jgi:uncharacterized protein (UPF0332 family)